MSKLYLQVQDINAATDDSGFFSLFKRLFPTEYDTIFGEIPTASLDIYVNFAFGSKLLLSAITYDNWQTILEAVIRVHLRNWVQLGTLNNIDYDVLDTTTSQTIQTRNSSSTDTDNGTNANSSKPFNETELVEYERNDNDNTNTKESNETVTTVTKGIKGSVADTLINDLQWRKEHIKLQIVGELINEITVSIY